MLPPPCSLAADAQQRAGTRSQKSVNIENSTGSVSFFGSIFQFRRSSVRAARAGLADVKERPPRQLRLERLEYSPVDETCGR
jgi:hypothetical protein